MNKDTVENIPPILQDWVRNMNEASLPHVSMNYYTMLKNVSEYINKQLKTYDNAQLSKNVMKKGKK